MPDLIDREHSLGGTAIFTPQCDDVFDRLGFGSDADHDDFDVDGDCVEDDYGAEPEDEGDAELADEGDAELADEGDAELADEGDAELADEGDAELADEGDAEQDVGLDDTQCDDAQVIIEVGPLEARGNRLVSCRHGDVEHRDLFNINRADKRKRFLKDFARKAGLSFDDVANLDQAILDKADAVDHEGELAEVDESAREAFSESKEILANTPQEIVEKAQEFLNNPEMFEQLKGDFQALGIVGEERLATTVYLIGTSRLLERPLAGCIKSASCTGKSHTTEVVEGCLPPEQVVSATNLSPNALYYMPPGSLKSKFITVAERQHVSSRDEGAEANSTLALREMISKQRLDKYVTVAARDGGFEVLHIEQEGPIAYLETTTRADIFDEDATRMVPLATDESEAQTVEIMKLQALEAAGKTAAADQQEQIREVHRTAQRMLRPLRVRIPFAPKLSLPATSSIARRAFPQLLGCIQAVALLRQFQKVEQDGWIDADVADYAIARWLMEPIVQRIFAPINERAAKLQQAIVDKLPTPTAEFTQLDCRKWAGIGATDARNRIAALIEAGAVEQVAGKQGVQCRYRLRPLESSARGPALRGLPTAEELEARLRSKPKRGRNKKR